MLGSTIEFWADSSYGDSSEHYTAMVRVVDSGVSPAPGGSGWYVDVISTQWVGEPLGGCHVSGSHFTGRRTARLAETSDSEE